MSMFSLRNVAGSVAYVWFMGVEFIRVKDFSLAVRPSFSHSGRC
jgi:hypothetical protein